MIEILTKIGVKITIIVVENREPYYFIIIINKCKEVPLSLFSYQMLASTFDSDEWSNYYKVYCTPFAGHSPTNLQVTSVYSVTNDMK